MSELALFLEGSELAGRMALSPAPTGRAVVARIPKSRNGIDPQNVRVT